MRRWIMVWLALAVFAGADSLRASGLACSGPALKGGELKIGMTQILQMPAREYVTYDPYAKKKIRYKGVLLRDFAAAYGKESLAKIVFSAIDGYTQTLLREEWQRWDILLAYEMEGKRLDLRTSGPLRIVFPYDQVPKELQRQLDPKWIWLINRAEFR